MGNNPYSPHTEADRAEMLARIGVTDIDELLGAIPAERNEPADETVARFIGEGIVVPIENVALDGNALRVKPELCKHLRDAQPGRNAPRLAVHADVNWDSQALLGVDGH